MRFYDFLPTFQLSRVFGLVILMGSLSSAVSNCVPGQEFTEVDLEANITQFCYELCGDLISCEFSSFGGFSSTENCPAQCASFVQKDNTGIILCMRNKLCDGEGCNETAISECIGSEDTTYYGLPLDEPPVLSIDISMFGCSSGDEPVCDDLKVVEDQWGFIPYVALRANNQFPGYTCFIELHPEDTSQSPSYHVRLDPSFIESQDVTPENYNVPRQPDGFYLLGQMVCDSDTPGMIGRSKVDVVKDILIILDLIIEAGKKIIDFFKSHKCGQGSSVACIGKANSAQCDVPGLSNPGGGAKGACVGQFDRTAGELKNCQCLRPGGICVPLSIAHSLLYLGVVDEKWGCITKNGTWDPDFLKSIEIATGDSDTQREKSVAEFEKGHRADWNTCYDIKRSGNFEQIFSFSMTLDDLKTWCGDLIDKISQKLDCTLIFMDPGGHALKAIKAIWDESTKMCRMNTVNTGEQDNPTGSYEGANTTPGEQWWEYTFGSGFNAGKTNYTAIGYECFAAEKKENATEPCKPGSALKCDEPSQSPSMQPSISPSALPSQHPSTSPSLLPSRKPSTKPSEFPYISPSSSPSVHQSYLPSATPSQSPKIHSELPSESPSRKPSESPIYSPSSDPSAETSELPTAAPSEVPIATPSSEPPSDTPSPIPSTKPSASPLASPNQSPSTSPSGPPSQSPSTKPSGTPSVSPSSSPSTHPLELPSTSPTSAPTQLMCSSAAAQSQGDVNCLGKKVNSRGDCEYGHICKYVKHHFGQVICECQSLTPEPTEPPSESPSESPSATPSSEPPSDTPSRIPNTKPSALPSASPNQSPSTSAQPSQKPSAQPSEPPSVSPSSSPSKPPSAQPSQKPSAQPSESPSASPSSSPSKPPSPQPSQKPSAQPSESPSASPSPNPSKPPSAQPSQKPSAQPSEPPSVSPSSSPSALPSFSGPSISPSVSPSQSPSKIPYVSPSSSPSKPPSAPPSQKPSAQPSNSPSALPSSSPITSTRPTGVPTAIPGQPTSVPTPTSGPTAPPEKACRLTATVTWMKGEHIPKRSKPIPKCPFGTLRNSGGVVTVDEKSVLCGGDSLPSRGKCSSDAAFLELVAVFSGPKTPKKYDRCTVTCVAYCLMPGVSLLNLKTDLIKDCPPSTSAPTSSMAPSSSMTPTFAPSKTMLPTISSQPTQPNNTCNVAKKTYGVIGVTSYKRNDTSMHEGFGGTGYNQYRTGTTFPKPLCENPSTAPTPFPAY